MLEYEFSDENIFCASSSDGFVVITAGECWHTADTFTLNKPDIIALAKAIGITAEDLR